MASKSIFQEVGSLRGSGWYRGLKVAKSCSYKRALPAHFLRYFCGRIITVLINTLVSWKDDSDITGKFLFFGLLDKFHQ